MLIRWMEAVAASRLFRRFAVIAVALFLSAVAACVAGISMPMPWVSDDVVESITVGPCRAALVYRPFPLMNGDVYLDVRHLDGTSLLRRYVRRVDVRDDVEYMSIKADGTSVSVDISSSLSEAVDLPAACQGVRPEA